jgi:hypothetical protein
LQVWPARRQTASFGVDVERAVHALLRTAQVASLRCGETQGTASHVSHVGTLRGHGCSTQRACSGRMKLVRSVSTALASHSASMAAPASSPARPPPNASKTVPIRLFASSSMTATACVVSSALHRACASSQRLRS